MTYVMSDLHGCYDAYLQMLSLIGFSAEDHLYVLGDVLDRGEKPLQMLMDLYGRKNATLLLGNHEYMARDVLRNPSNPSPAAETRKLNWYMNGGDLTANHFSLLPERDRMLLCDYLDELPAWKILTVGEKTFVLVHAGLEPLESVDLVSRQSVRKLVWLRPDLSQEAFSDPNVFVVFGHTPTKLLIGEWKIARENRNICVDCGVAYGGRLACLRLEDMKEFYL